MTLCQQFACFAFSTMWKSGTHKSCIDGAEFLMVQSVQMHWIRGSACVSAHGIMFIRENQGWNHSCINCTYCICVWMGNIFGPSKVADLIEVATIKKASTEIHHAVKISFNPTKFTILNFSEKCTLVHYATNSYCIRDHFWAGVT